jgi:hypothetical protein
MMFKFMLPVGVFCLSSATSIKTRAFLLGLLYFAWFATRVLSQAIDPVVDYAFYVPGGAGSLSIGASATDVAGNTYIAGTVAYPSNYSQEAYFVSKYNAAGEEVYSTILGTSQFPDFSGSISGMAVDSAGKVYLVGEVSGAYGGALGAAPNGYYTSAPNPYSNGFLIVLNAAGTALTYSTYFSGNGGGSTTAVAVDQSGDAYVTGTSTGTLPTTAGAPFTAPFTGGAGFVAKFNTTITGTSSLIYCTYLGATEAQVGFPGSQVDSVNGIFVDSKGDAYVTGNAGVGATYPTTAGAYTYDGRSPVNDAYVTEINPAGTAFLLSARLGPGSGNAIALDGSGDIYVTGTVYEDDYPTTSGAYQTSYPSGFVTELNPAGSSLIYSTFLGGPSDQLASGSSYVSPSRLSLPPGCASDCPIFIAGSTNGIDLPLLNQTQSYVPASNLSGFYMELAGGGASILQSSYIASGAGLQSIAGIGVDSASNIYITGNGQALYVPVTEVVVSGTTGNGFFAKIGSAAGAKLAVSPSSITFPQQVIDVSTAQEGLASQIVQLENLGNKAVTISSITSSSTNFTQTNNCNGTVAAGEYCTLTLSFTPSAAYGAASPKTATLKVASNASVNPTIQLSGTAIADRFFASSCGGVSPCPSLSYADTVVGSSAGAQIMTLTNLGSGAAVFSGITSNLPDYSLLTNCPQSGNGLAHGKSCEVSVEFHPTQIGVRSGTIAITSAGTTANPINITATGTGLLSPNSSSLVLLDKTLNFGTETIGATTGALTVTIFNNGSSPATVFTPTTSTTGDATGTSDYAISSNKCGDLLPQSSCTFAITFSPTATGTRSGTLSIPTSSTSTPLTSSLVGYGTAEKQELEFTPNSITFPEQVIDANSSAVAAYIYNVGPTPVSIDRVTITGEYEITVDTCSQTTLPAAPLTLQYQSCYVQVIFSPTATGLHTGTVTVIDTEGRQSALSLAGTGAVQTGSILLGAGGLNFGGEPVGTTAGAQDLYVTNVGNSPVTVTAASASGDYSAGYSPQNNTCAAAPFTLQPGGQCGYGIYFTPSKVANPDNGTFTLTTSAGTRTASLTGIGEAASKVIVLTPSSTSTFSFGNVEVGQTAGVSPYEITNVVTVFNAGTDPVTLSASPAITGTNASDFGLSLASGDGACGGAGAILSPGSSCAVYLDFKPSAEGARNAVLSIADDATTGGGIQTLPLTGTGTSTEPTYSFEPETVAFYAQPATTTSGGTTVSFFNDGATPITISSITLQPIANFALVPGYCSGGTIAAGGTCVAAVKFAPTASGAVHGTMTLTDSNGTTYTAQLYGYGTPDTDYLFVNPTGLAFSTQPQFSTSGVQQVLIYNYSTLAATIGQTTGTNAIVGSSTSGAFKVTSDGCSNQGMRSNYPYPCSIQVALSPTTSTAIGAQTGSLKIPVTYGDGKTGSYKVALSGTVVAPIDAAELSPTKLTFPDLAVNNSSAAQCVQLTNSGNLPLTVGTLTSTNTGASGPFVVTGSGCGTFLCGGNLNAGASCSEEIEFNPSTVGSGINGTLSFPITYGDGKTTTLTASYSGNALAAKNSLLIEPLSANFGSQVVGQAAGGIVFTITNNGNQPIAISGETLTSVQAGANFTRNGYGYNQCGAETLAPGGSCPVWVEFAPQTTGTITGTLTIGDGTASGGPHTIPLTGTGLAANQQLSVSQTTVNFGSVAVGGASAPQAVYLNNQSDINVNNMTYALGGTNSSDFTLNSAYCGGFIWSRFGAGSPTCTLYVTFNPAKASLGARTATVTVGFSGSGSPITITLNGTGVPPAPAVTLFPTSLTYPIQSVGVKSAAQSFSVYNTGSASLTISKIASTNAAEFPISANGCGGTLAAGGSCLVSVEFDPSAAGARTGSIQVTDNATGSPQTVALSGTGQLAPEVSLSTSTVTFASQNVGSTSAAQTITVSNTGTATLDISSIAVGGTDPSDFTQTDTCGTTLVVKASCTISVKFDPTAAGSRTATLVLTDNANDVAGSTQSIALGGTGVGVPIAAIAPKSLAFGSVAVGTSSPSQTVTLTNSGTAPLAISNVALGGSGADDFVETNSCPASLGIEGSCLITVAFKPTATGAKSATLVITDNNGLVTGSTQSVALSGTASADASKRSVSPASGD